MHGFQINQKLGKQEWLARLGGAVPARHAECAYGTGWDISASDALTYVLFQTISRLATPTVKASESLFAGLRPSIQDFTASGAAVLRYHCYAVCKQAQNLSHSPVTPASIVDMVRRTFSLNVSDTADVFKVSRPTIYQWSKLESMDLIRASQDRDRLKTLYGIVVGWAARPALRGPWYRQVLPSGQSVVDLLKGERIDSAEFTRIHIWLEQQSHVLQATEHIKARQVTQRLREATIRMDAERPKKPVQRQGQKAKEDI